MTSDDCGTRNDKSVEPAPAAIICEVRISYCPLPTAYWIRQTNRRRKTCFCQEFEFYEPKTLKEACQIMGDLGRAAGLLAGGTDLLVNMKKKVVRPSHVVSLGRLAELKTTDSKDDEIRSGLLHDRCERLPNQAS